MFGCRERSRVRGGIKVVRDVDVTSGVGVGQRAEGIDVLDGAECGHIKGVIAAALCDLNVGERAVPLDLEGDVDAMAGGLRVDFLGDLLDVVGEAGAKGGVGGSNADGSGASLGAAHGDAGG